MIVFLVLLALIYGVGSEPMCIVHHKNGGFENNIKCTNNDTYCGSWDNRVFTPVGCKFREVTQENALKCMANRTIGCMGDSQMASLCTSFGMFLYGYNEYDELIDNLWDVRETYIDFPKFKPEYKYMATPLDWDRLSAILPTASTRIFSELTWQTIQLGTYTLGSMKEYLPMILNNSYQHTLTNKDNNLILPQMDFAFVNSGLHNQSLFNTGEHGESYFNKFVQAWIDMKDNVKVPSVWTSMNNECNDKIDIRYKTTTQAYAVEEANWYAHKRLHELKLPYFDMGAPVRTPQRCEVQHDGVHVHHYVNIVNAKIILNFLCDDDWNWIGSLKPFIGNNNDY